MSNIIWRDANPGYRSCRLELVQDAPLSYTVVYGAEVFDGLSYYRATRKLGECIMDKATIVGYIPPDDVEVTA